MNSCLKGHIVRTSLILLTLAVCWPASLYAAPAPTLSSASPGLVISTAPQTVTVTGSRLQTGLRVTVTQGSTPIAATVADVQATRFTLTLTVATSGLLSVTVRNQDGKTATLSVPVGNVTAPPPPPSAPPPPPPSSGWTLCANEGATCSFTGTRDVRYGANTSYNVKVFTTNVVCSNDVFGDPVYGVVKHCDVGPETTAPAPTPTPTPPMPTTARGPTSSITCPATSTPIIAGSSIQAAINAYPAGTTFCIGAGTTFLRASITPKSGDVFIGVYGAILDGTGWTSTEANAAAFAATGSDVINVQIRNLEISNMPKNGVGLSAVATGWILENNNIHHNGRTGVAMGKNGIVRKNVIHHNAYSGYSAYGSDGVLFEDNEFSYNGSESKIVGASNVVFRSNWVHHNDNGIWYDTARSGSLIENNLVEDNTNSGIVVEISPVNVPPGTPSSNIIRNNIIRNHTLNDGIAIFISSSHSIEVSGNTTANNRQNLSMFLDCAALEAGVVDLRDNNVHDNDVTVSGTGGSGGNWAASFTFVGCTSPTIDAYLNRAKNLVFARNTYHVASPDAGQYWRWGTTQMTFSAWQALGHDVTGLVK